MTRNQIIATTLGALLALAGCAPPGAIDPEDKVEDPTLDGGKEDRWNSANDPERFDGEFNYHAADLPTEGSAERDLWPSTYWPTYEDSINARWMSGELSPAQKYDQAFNGWTPSTEFQALRPFDRNNAVPGTGWDVAYYEGQGPLASHVSQNMGNRRDRELAVSSSGMPEGEWPVETWWGLCHAWVPAAILEDRPLRSVEYNGVTFHVGDLEALLIAAYNRTPADMIGGRCNTGSGDTTVERDEFGRAVDVDCRDSNPGAMHVVVTNYLGLNQRGFAMDRTYDYQVWNQPVVGYEITRQREITVTEANELLGRTGETYEYNADAAKLYDVHMSLRWITESHASTTPADSARHTRTDYLTYILEVDAEGKIIGGEWYGNSRTTHPDFLWNPRRLTRSSVPYLDLENVRMLIAMSRGALEPEPSGDALSASGTGALSIPDNDANGVRSVANIAGGTGTVSSVRVDVDLTHTYIGDLELVLEHGGVSRTIHNREGGSADDIVRAFDVVGFESLDPNGEWTLVVRDRAGADTGTLNGWRVTVSTGEGTPTPPPPATEQRFEGMGGVAIPDNAPAGATSTAQVSGGMTGRTVVIDVNITHTYVGDLTVEVTAPTGRTFMLHNRMGGSADDLHQQFPLDATGNAFTGDPNGSWTLKVVDGADADEGTLDTWAVVLR